LTLELIRQFTIFIVRNEFTNKGFLRAGELAQATGVSTDTLRHYESKGVLTKPRRSRNGYREYPTEALARVRLVRRALAVGFTLDELAQILKERDKGGVPCRAVRTLAAEKLRHIEAQIGELVFVREELRVTLANWDSLLAGKNVVERAGLLEALASADSPHNRTLPAPNWRRRNTNKSKTNEEKPE
jgi:DNA-binding transcriptional MerR regulator